MLHLEADVVAVGGVLVHALKAGRGRRRERVYCFAEIVEMILLNQEGVIDLNKTG